MRAVAYLCFMCRKWGEALRLQTAGVQPLVGASGSFRCGPPTDKITVLEAVAAGLRATPGGARAIGGAIVAMTGGRGR